MKLFALFGYPNPMLSNLAGGQVADEKEASFLRHWIAGVELDFGFATIWPGCLDWQIDAHTRYADGNSDAAGKDTPFRDGPGAGKLSLTCGWTFARWRCKA